MSNLITIKSDFLIEQNNLHYFAWVGGDHNPIHYDKKVAESMNLPGVIAHGMYVYNVAVAQFENYLSSEGLKYKLLDNQCKFSGMALVGKKISIKVTKKSAENCLEKYLVTVVNSEDEAKLCSINLKIELLS